MKIKYENKTMTGFEELICGAVFRAESNFYMKIDSTDETGVNAVNLSTGELTYFPSYTNIEMLDAELTVTPAI